MAIEEIPLTSRNPTKRNWCRPRIQLVVDERDVRISSAHRHAVSFTTLQNDRTDSGSVSVSDTGDRQVPATPQSLPVT
jgi:hypothetical protein